MIRLLPNERAGVLDFIYTISGIALDSSKEYLVESRLSALMDEIRCASFSELVRRAQSESGGVLKRRIIDGITTNETLFFRDSSPFDLLRHKILPDLIDHRAGRGVKTPLRIWSAACSTGQEPYSVAMVLKEVLGDLSRYDIRLLGTDISDQAIARASRAVYSQNEMERGLAASVRSKYFVPHANGWQVRDDIRAMASFRRLNLMENFAFLGRFDIVFCRNVAIYFNDKDRASLFSRIERCLEPDGYLIIGSTELLKDICPQFEPKQYLRSVFYQVKPGLNSRVAS